MKVTPELAEAITRLRVNTDFNLFLSAIGDHGERLIQQMIYTQEDGQLRSMQGEARAVTEILKSIHTAEKHRNNTP